MCYLQVYNLIHIYSLLKNIIYTQTTINGLSMLHTYTHTYICVYMYVMMIIKENKAIDLRVGNMGEL